MIMCLYCMQNVKLVNKEFFFKKNRKMCIYTTTPSSGQGGATEEA